MSSVWATTRYKKSRCENDVSVSFFSPKIRFTDLEDDVIGVIFHELDLKDLIRVSRVCKSIYPIAKETV